MSKGIIGRGTMARASLIALALLAANPIAKVQAIEAPRLDVRLYDSIKQKDRSKSRTRKKGGYKR